MPDARPTESPPFVDPLPIVFARPSRPSRLRGLPLEGQTGPALPRVPDGDHEAAQDDAKRWGSGTPSPMGHVRKERCE